MALRRIVYVSFSSVLRSLPIGLALRVVDETFSFVLRGLPVGLALRGTVDVSFGSVLRSLAATRSCAETTDLLGAETLILNILYTIFHTRRCSLEQQDCAKTKA